MNKPGRYWGCNDIALIKSIESPNGLGIVDRLVVSTVGVNPFSTSFINGTMSSGISRRTCCSKSIQK